MEWLMSRGPETQEWNRKEGRIKRELEGGCRGLGPLRVCLAEMSWSRYSCWTTPDFPDGFQPALSSFGHLTPKVCKRGFGGCDSGQQGAVSLWVLAVLGVEPGVLGGGGCRGLLWQCFNLMLPAWPPGWGWRGVAFRGCWVQGQV